MRKFRYASFFGFSAPIALMLPEEEFLNFLNLTTSMTSYTLIKNLRLEFEMLLRFFDNIKEVPDPDAKMKILEGFSTEAEFARYQSRMKRFLSGKPTPAGFEPKHTKEEFERLQRQLDDLPKTIAHTITYGGASEPLTPEQHKVLLYFYRKKNVIKQYLKEIDKTLAKHNLTAERFLGTTFNTIKNAPSFGIINTKVNSRYSDSLEKLSERDKRDFLEQWRNDCTTLLTLNQKEETTTISIPYESTESLDIIFERVNQMAPQYGFEKIEFIELFNITGDRSLLNDLDTLDSVLRIRRIVKHMDIGLFNGVFDLKLEASEYEELFTSLEKYGFVGLNLYSINFFDDALSTTLMYKKTSLTEKLSPDSVGFQNTLLLLQEIESKLYRQTGGQIL